MSQIEDIPQPPASSQAEGTPRPPSSSLAIPTCETVRQKRKIAELEEKLQELESGQAAKRRETNYYISKGRAIRRIVSLFDSIEDLICENDRRCDNDDDNDNDNDYTLEQDRLQVGYVALNNALPWFHRRASDMEYDDYAHMLKQLRQGADSARGDDTSKLKSLVPDWVNREFKPNLLMDPEDKYNRGFVNDESGRLLCPAELNWNNPIVRAGIRDRTDGYVVTEMSWPAFLYEGYTTDLNNLEKGLFKSKLLVQVCHASQVSSVSRFAGLQSDIYVSVVRKGSFWRW